MAVTKPVSFKNKEYDLLEYIEGKDFSYYVKELIRKDMGTNKKTKAEMSETPVLKKKRITDYDI